MFIFWLPNLGMGGSPASGPVALYIPYEYTSVLIMTANDTSLDPWGIDPDQTIVILAGNTDAFGIDPDQTVALPTENDTADDPWGIDPDQTTLITSGLTATD